MSLRLGIESVWDMGSRKGKCGMRNAERGVLLNFNSYFCLLPRERGKLPPTVIFREFRGGPLNAFRFFCWGTIRNCQADTIVQAPTVKF